VRGHSLSGCPRYPPVLANFIQRFWPMQLARLAGAGDSGSARCLSPRSGALAGNVPTRRSASSRPESVIDRDVRARAMRSPSRQMTRISMTPARSGRGRYWFRVSGIRRLQMRPMRRGVAPVVVAADEPLHFVIAVHRRPRPRGAARTRSCTGTPPSRSARARDRPRRGSA
jgi:hypothetical protein